MKGEDFYPECLLARSDYHNRFHSHTQAQSQAVCEACFYMLISSVKLTDRFGGDLGPPAAPAVSKKFIKL